MNKAVTFDEPVTRLLQKKGIKLTCILVTALIVNFMFILQTCCLHRYYKNLVLSFHVIISKLPIFSPFILDSQWKSLYMGNVEGSKIKIFDVYFKEE